MGSAEAAGDDWPDAAERGRGSTLEVERHLAPENALDGLARPGVEVDVHADDLLALEIGGGAAGNLPAGDAAIDLGIIGVKGEAFSNPS